MPPQHRLRETDSTYSAVGNVQKRKPRHETTSLSSTPPLHELLEDKLVLDDLSESSEDERLLPNVVYDGGLSDGTYYPMAGSEGRQGEGKGKQRAAGQGSGLGMARTENTRPK
jgi:hypothetical protein